jgi:hypothetical protein
MVAMVALCETRIRYIYLLVHLVGDDIADGIEEGGYSYGRRFPGRQITSNVHVLSV